MIHRLSLTDWNRWRLEAKECGLVDTFADLDDPNFYKRDIEDEREWGSVPVFEEREEAA